MDQIKVELQDSMGNDKSIAEAAWTSSLDYQKKKTRTEEDIKRVVQMLANNKHATPFESVVLRFWIKMPIAIDRQFMTHRIQSANGMSGRYRTMPREWLAVSNDIDIILTKVNPSLVGEYNDICKKANDWYESSCLSLKEDEKNGLISNSEYKRVREFIRGVLPQHNMTERVSVMNLRAFCNFQKLRNSSHAQPEIKQVAELMLESVKKSNICPIAIELLEKNNWQL